MFFAGFGVLGPSGFKEFDSVVPSPLPEGLYSRFIDPIQDFVPDLLYMCRHTLTCICIYVCVCVCKNVDMNGSLATHRVRENRMIWKRWEGLGLHIQ